MHAAGQFEVEVKQATGQAAPFGRMVLSKRYHGELEATAAGEMLSGGDPKGGTAGYVALETVSGTLMGKQGSFQLMHWGTMESGRLDLRVGVVPGSGTGSLTGLAGTMKIAIAPAGEHSYTLDYTLPAAS